METRVGRTGRLAGILSLVAFALGGAELPAQAYRSSQPHDGMVAGIKAKADEQSFFSAGEDGFLVKWGRSGQGETKGERYQISDMPIGLLDLNPADGDVAVYESDGISANRVAVYDWNGFGRRFAKRFKNSVSCLSYSAKGSYLFVGTAAINGMYILDAKSGDVLKNIKTIPGVITMARTGPSETTAIMYSPSGFLYYWDMKKGNVKARFSTEASLEQPCLFGGGKFQNRFFAGVRGNTIYVMDATSGATLASYNASRPMLASCDGEHEEGLYYVSDRGRGYSLSLIRSDSLEAQLTASASRASLPSSSLVKNFMGLKSSDSFVSIAKNQESVILGTKGGDLYSFPDIPESEAYSLAPLTQGGCRRVSDISLGDDSGQEAAFYALAAGKIFRMDFGGDSPEEVADAPAGADSLLCQGQDFYLWTKDEKAPVYRLSAATGQSEQLFTPGGPVSKLRVDGGKILTVLGNSSVFLYDSDTNKSTKLYSGTSIQDAVLAGRELYVAKAVAGAGDSALIRMNLDTKETVPLKTNGAVAFSLSYGGGKEIYGIEIETAGDDEYLTQVFSYDSEAKSFRSLLRLNDEDGSASTQLCGDTLYTNIGRTQIYAYSLKTKRSSTYRRTASLPVKAVGSPRLMAVLNQNGSISWYKDRTKQALASWQLSDEGEWQGD